MSSCLCYRGTASTTSCAGSARTFRSEVTHRQVRSAFTGVGPAADVVFPQVNGKSLSLKQLMEEPTLSLVSADFLAGKIKAQFDLLKVILVFLGRCVRAGVFDLQPLWNTAASIKG